MIVATKLDGVFIHHPDKHQDARGFFAELICDKSITQHCVSFNYLRGTLRGLHYQKSPYEQTKIVRCTAGSIYDVVVDLRVSSPTYLQYVQIELSAENRYSIHVPKGFAHGFQTIVDSSEVFYQFDAPYNAEASSGVRWDDTIFSISWPLPVSIICDRDRTYSDYKS